MLTKRFAFLVTEAMLPENASKEFFLADYPLSSVFDEDSDLAENARECEAAWDAAHMDVLKLIEMSDMTYTKFAERFCIGKNTLNSWLYRGVKPPIHVTILLAESLGLLNKYKK